VTKHHPAAPRAAIASTAAALIAAALAGRVRVVELPGVSHGFIGRDSAGRAVDWMSGRFADAPAPNDCAR
jgi:predicted RNA-binding Zn ribbon-like protein